MTRVCFRGAALMVALLLALAPTVTTAQSTTNTGVQAPATGAQGNNAGPQSAGGTSSNTGATSNGTTTTNTTTTTSSTRAFGVSWAWIAVGAVVLVVILGLVAMSGNRTTSSTTIRRE
jgi:hypothetical protein